MRLIRGVFAFVVMSALAVAGQSANKLPISLTIKFPWPPSHTVETDIDATLKNVSHQTLHLLPARLSFYTYEVKRDGIVIPETDAGRKLREDISGGQPTIDDTFRPNQIATDRIRINELRDTSQPGTYTIQVFWPIDWSKPTENVVKSNIITVTVE